MVSIGGGGRRGLRGRCSAPGGDEGGVDTDLGAEGDAAQYGR